MSIQEEETLKRARNSYLCGCGKGAAKTTSPGRKTMKASPPPPVKVTRTLTELSPGSPLEGVRQHDNALRRDSDARAPSLSARPKPGCVFTRHPPPTYPPMTHRCSTAI
ncbi:Os07g0267250 [Oryza sativa Japonica Group]|uniref:Os07g0267250 protein n=1 Tax=Oryza sativa subsp. japonica TaxID=39947 RepID=A0A0P0X4X4_ORYSJ|nr:Os07g0267250 [Oryza sativa Japonica Group]